MTNGIRALQPNEVPVLVSEGHVVTEDRRGLSIYSKSNHTGFPSQYIPGVEYAVADYAGQLLASTYDGRLLRIDPATGRSTILFDARRGVVETAVFAIVSGVLFPILWLVFASRCRSLSAFAECAAAMGILFAACVVWWSIAVPSCLMQEEVLRFQMRLALVTMLPLIVVWASTLSSKWGKVLPFVAVVFASVLFATVASMNPSRLSEFVVVAGLLLLWQTGGFAVFRSLFGIVSHTDSPPTSPPQLTFTIRQLIALTAGFALIFTCLRFTGIKSDEYPGTVAWLTTVTMMNSLVTLFAVGLVFYCRNTLLAFLVWICLTGAAATTHYALATQTGLDTNDLRRMQWYPMAIISGLLVFVLCRYARGHGYELRPMTASRGNRSPTVGGLVPNPRQ